ncbi:MAG TPA: sialate O-acetylesterase [Gemmatimonadaceae bacterium]|nr:sialate O-acetylesterase [Gemmatimonadaceae bacterium]
MTKHGSLWLSAPSPWRALGVVLSALVALDAGAQSTAPLRLASHLTDGVVLQRGVAMPVWGWGAPGARVVVALDGRSAQATADAAGRWSLALPAAAAGGPHILTVTSGGRELAVRDVLVGDVWVASGQSNMEWPLSMAATGREDVAVANDSLLRELKVPIAWAPRPQDTLPTSRWSPADPQHAGAMSAVGYHFARALRQSQRVPIGIVNASWGGSAIETWMSARSQGLTPAAVEQTIAAEQRRLDSTIAALRGRLGITAERDPGLADGRALWADPALDDASWLTIRVPGLWETQGYEGMDGVAWYRTAFTLTAAEAAQGARLVLGAIDDDDVTWVNGVEVGRTSGYNRAREYAVPASALRAGRNVLAIRVADYAGGGGLYAAADSVYLAVGGARRALAGEWRFRVGELSARSDGQRTNKLPAITYNAMIHPLLGMPIRGVIWYQGESNADDEREARAYRAQFASMIEGWRAAWARGPRRPTPFLWVQLPNFMRADAEPTATGGAWAIHREAMSAALRLPATGQAVTLDLGDPEDIHPRRKREVGQRLALVAQKVAYGDSVLASGPSLRAHRVERSNVVLEFDHVGGGLVARGGEGRLGGFAIAGADGRFVWADARIEGSRVIVSSPRVPTPVAVRYAWANNASTANLFNREGLPAAPFRTDRW